MDLDELKRTWQSQSTRIDRLEAQNRELRRCVRENKVYTKRSKLMRTYTWLLITSVVMIPFVLLAFPTLDIDMGVTIMFVVTMAGLAIANSYVYMLIKKIDPTEMSVREALSRVLYLDRTRQRIRWVSMTVAVVVVSIFFYTLYQRDGHAGLLGGIVGGIVGGILGLRKEAEIKATIRAIKADLEDALQDD